MDTSHHLGFSHEIVLEQGPIRYCELGSGSPIVFVHGLLTNGMLWRKVVPELSENFHCIAPDWPLGSHEMAMNPKTELSPAGLAKIIADFLQKLDLQDITLVGNNTGGALCQVVVARYPERIGRLVLLPSDTFDNFLPAMFRYLQWSARIPGMLYLLLQLMRIRALRRLPIAYGWVQKRNIEEAVSDSYTESCFLDPAVRRDLRKVLRGISPEYTLEAAKSFAKFTKPVLIAWAKEDRVFPAKDAEQLAAAFPNARLEWIDDSYTFAAEDNPARVIELISSFIQQSPQ